MRGSMPVGEDGRFTFDRNTTKEGSSSRSFPRI
jgi:hypothetical protein